MSFYKTIQKKYDKNLIFLAFTLFFILFSALVYFGVKNYFLGDTGIFVATPSGIATLSITPGGTVAFTPGQSKQFSVVVNNIPAGKSISAIGFSLKLNGVSASNLVVSSAFSAAEVKQFEPSGANLNYVVATKYSTPLNITNGATIATFTLTAPNTPGTISNAVTSIVTEALPSIVDSTGVEIMNSTNSLQPISVSVSTPALSAPTFNVAADTVYNNSTNVTVTLPNNPGGVALNYCLNATRAACTAGTAVPSNGVITVTSTGYVYVTATKSGYTSSNAFSPKFTLNDNPAMSSVTMSSGSGNSSIFVSGQNITITANNVSDSVNGVTKVSFYKVEGTTVTLLGEDTTSPYSYIYTSPTIGSYSFRATAVDAFGGSTSLTVPVTVKPLAPTFVPNGGTSATPFSVTINNPNSGGTVKYAICDNCAPTTNYSSPISLSTSNKITANVTLNSVTSDNAVSAQFTVTGKVAAPVFTPASGLYYYAPSTPNTWTFVKVASSTTGAISSYCVTANLSATTCSNYQNYTEGVTELPINSNFKIFARATKADWTTSDTVSAVYKIYGDANLDNKFDISDIIATLPVLFDSNSSAKTETMDCNKTATGYGDGKIDLFDILQILSLIFG